MNHKSFVDESTEMSTRNFEYVARPADANDWPGIWALLEPNIRDGIWFPIPSDFTEAQARNFWCPESHAVFVGDRDGEIVWTSCLGMSIRSSCINGCKP